MSDFTLAIVNARAGLGAAGPRWSRLEARVRERVGALRVEHTRAPRDAERIAREGVSAGARRLIVVGGDGTANEVVTGLLASGLGARCTLALLPLGTGCDLARSLGVPRDPLRAIEHLARPTACPLDAGRLTLTDEHGAERETFFVNVASAGISGLVDRLAKCSPAWLGARAAFLLGTLRGLVHWRNVPCRVQLDGAPVYDGPLLLAAAANGRYFGGGMHLAPRARIDDGLLDLVVVKDVAAMRLVANLPRLYRGTHLDHPDVIFRRGARVEVLAPSPVWLDVDGESLSARRACFEVMPAALRMPG